MVSDEPVERIPARQLREGDQIVLTVSSVVRTRTGYVEFYCDGAMHLGTLYVMEPGRKLPVRRKRRGQ